MEPSDQILKYFESDFTNWVFDVMKPESYIVRITDKDDVVSHERRVATIDEVTAWSHELGLTPEITFDPIVKEENGNKINISEV